MSAKLSKPNIFILNNRWDASASGILLTKSDQMWCLEDEDQREQVRDQHQNRFVQFLTEELKVCTKEEATSRFFFISAREMLEDRLKKKGEIKNGMDFFLKPRFTSDLSI